MDPISPSVIPQFEERPTPQLKHVEQVSAGWIKKYILTFEMPDGREYHYESVSRKNADDYRNELEANARGSFAGSSEADAVCIAPITQDGRLVMIREFRYPLNSYCIGLPAGLMEKGEDLAECAARELWEETGYAVLRDEKGALKINILPQAGYSSVGMSGESVQVLFALVENEPSLGQKTEESEFIQVFTLPVNQIEEFLNQNTTPIGTRAQLVLESFLHRADSL